VDTEEATLFREPGEKLFVVFSVSPHEHYVWLTWIDVMYFNRLKLGYRTTAQVRILGLEEQTRPVYVPEVRRKHPAERHAMTTRPRQHGSCSLYSLAIYSGSLSYRKCNNRHRPHASSSSLIRPAACDRMTLYVFSHCGRAALCGHGSAQHAMGLVAFSDHAVPMVPLTTLSSSELKATVPCPTPTSYVSPDRQPILVLH